MRSNEYVTTDIYDREVTRNESVNDSFDTTLTLPEKCSNTELFLVRIFLYSD